MSKKITVSTFIELYEISESKFFSSEIDRQVSLLSILTGRPESDFFDMDLQDFKKCKKLLDVLDLKNIEPKATKLIKANGRFYAPVYDFTKFTAGQFVDVVSFAKDPEKIIENLPQIMASICVPVRRKFLRLIPMPYGSILHKEVAKDMEKANILDAYSIAVFFWAVWTSLLENTGNYLVSDYLKTKGTTELTTTETAALLTILESYGDGIAARKESL